MIAYWFPPIKAVTLRSYYIYQEWKKHFKEVYVLTTSNRNRLPLEAVPIEEKDINSIPTLDYRTLNSFRNSSKAHFTQQDRKKKSAGFLTRLLDSFPFNLLIGEGGFIYIILGFWQANQLIKKHQIANVYSSFRPYSDHIIAWLLKKKHPQLFWIADFRDLHIDHNHNDLFWVSFQKWCNRKIISTADLVTTVSHGLATPLQKYSPPVYVLRNGYQHLYPTTETQTTDFFQITYTGSIYTAEQSPEILLKVIENLIQNGTVDGKKIKLIYAGKDGGIWEEWMAKHGLSSIFENKALLPRLECVKLQQKSHLNLLLSFTREGVKGLISGKIYEYLSARNPILSIFAGEKDEEYETFFEELNAGKIIYPDSNSNCSQEKELEVFITNLYREWLENGRVHQPINMEKLAEYQLENTIPQLLNYVGEISSNKER